MFIKLIIIGAVLLMSICGIFRAFKNKKEMEWVLTTGALNLWRKILGMDQEVYGESWKAILRGNSLTLGESRLGELAGHILRHLDNDYKPVFIKARVCDQEVSVSISSSQLCLGNQEYSLLCFTNPGVSRAISVAWKMLKGRDVAGILPDFILYIDTTATESSLGE